MMLVYSKLCLVYSTSQIPDTLFPFITVFFMSIMTRNRVRCVTVHPTTGVGGDAIPFIQLLTAYSIQPFSLCALHQ